MLIYIWKWNVQNISFYSNCHSFFVVDAITVFMETLKTYAIAPTLVIIFLSFLIRNREWNQPFSPYFPFGDKFSHCLLANIFFRWRISFWLKTTFKFRNISFYSNCHSFFVADTITVFMETLKTYAIVPTLVSD
jgi:hypothetical protein